MDIFRYQILIICPCLLASCISSQPKKTHNLCAIFKEKEDWYDFTENTYKKWGVPIHVQMAIMHQESRFIADAKPPKTFILGFIPWTRISSAYGYSQALDGTWESYTHATDNTGADRDDFEDASDFIGWYCTISHKKLGISKSNTAQQYLAYHEGQTGYRRKSYLKKPGLLKISKKVAKQATLFKRQLISCRQELGSSGWFFW